MVTHITLKPSGRVTVPKVLRKELQLDAGDQLQRAQSKAILKKERGVWVYQGKPISISVPDLIDRDREKQRRELMA
jgi:bifunctional DNA-binding transcriptional regulator/antitoxin component of YhaV-PrlF toxin-antitoxin module